MISVIIAACNEERSIRDTIAHVYAHASYKRFLQEVIVVDGGSTDGTVAEAEKTGATVITGPGTGKASQFNCGAAQASGEILYFLQSHALPPENFISEIVKAHSRGYAGGTFSLRFDCRHWLLNMLSWFTNNASWVYLSDQSLFVTRELFAKAGGFREDHLVMVNQEMIRRMRRYTNFILIKSQIVASAGKYLRYGILRTEAVHAIVFLLHRLGYPQHVMARIYRRFLQWNIGPKPQTVRRSSPQPAEVKKKIAALSQ